MTSLTHTDLQKNTNRAKTVELITVTVTSPKSRMQNNTQHCTYYVIILIVVFYRVHCCIITTFTPCKSLWSRLSRRQNRRLSRIFFRPAANSAAYSSNLHRLRWSKLSMTLLRRHQTKYRAAFDEAAACRHYL